ncbi:hypothetical protein [Candidatus Enterococcus mansonii]|uniref:DUF4367 domain-containing protein n=1 Tax=Candidatus Enterococcus mansonii TaxID=1834181 RepID=A0A242CE62_9ENTE|nr:hypothetical protein [Enterococcus sp. 4G2_DIV0659]OTO08408.1 hypothetical protein A5880_001408 [Enterococcus sp. 4G2_DIV0659]
MKDEYNKEIEKIRAPRHLIERTKIEMKKEIEKEQEKQSKFTVTVVLRRSAVAAIVILAVGVGGYSYYSSQNHIDIASVEQADFTIDKNFGQAIGKEKKDKIQVTEGKDKTIIPEFLAEVKESKIKGTTILLGKDSRNIFYAAYSKEDKYYYIVGKDVTEKEFIDFIKNKL